MAADPKAWRNANPADLSDQLPEVQATLPETVLAAAAAAAEG